MLTIQKILGIGAVAGVAVCAVMTPSALATPRCAVPAEDPNAAEVRAAMQIVGLRDDVPMPIAKAIDEGCFNGTQVALYDRLVRVILVGDRWRVVGGLTRLIHEMKHYADDLAGLPGDDECSASRFAAAWAEANGFTNEARRERRYGAAFCAAEPMVASAAPSGAADSTPASRLSQMADVLFLPPDN